MSRGLLKLGWLCKRQAFEEIAYLLQAEPTARGLDGNVLPSATIETELSGSMQVERGKNSLVTSHGVEISWGYNFYTTNGNNPAVGRTGKYYSIGDRLRYNNLIYRIVFIHDDFSNGTCILRCILLSGQNTPPQANSGDNHPVSPIKSHWDPFHRDIVVGDDSNDS